MRPVQVLLYDPLFDWTMNALKAFHLQRDEQQELNATLGSTMGGDNPDSPRKVRCAGGGTWHFSSKIFTFFIPTFLVLQRQSELQQGGGAGSAEAAGEAEGGGGRSRAQREGAGQPADPAGPGPQEPQQTLPRLAGLGVELPRNDPEALRPRGGWGRTTVVLVPGGDQIFILLRTFSSLIKRSFMRSFETSVE